ncbi:MAG: cysteine desulfurase [Clostridia bacterium]|nr:cysteine desulfurase [Clostridia bacterium]
MIKYFDNCATTKADEQVVDIITKYQTETYFNPSARSSFSLNIANDIANARQKIAKLLGATNAELVFTASGTEADNLAMLGTIRPKSGNVVLTESEHSAVFNTAQVLKNRGYEVRIAKTTTDGHIDVADFVSKVDSQTVLACFMHVNNETGAVNDVRTINALVKRANPRTLTFSDGVQAVGKIPVNFASLGVDLYSFSAHKIHAGKGVGCLIAKNGVRVNPIITGGGQEKGIRSGTEYVGGVVALATAVQNAVEKVAEHTEIFQQYKQILRNCLAKTPDWRENCTENCSPAIMSLAFRGIKGEVLLHMLEQFDIIVGTGSACSSKNKQSRIAKAIAMPLDYTEGILRISFSKYNTTDQVQLLGEKLAFCVEQLRKTMHYVTE